MGLSQTPRKGYLSTLSDFAGIDPAQKLKEFKKFKNSKDGQAFVAWIRDQHIKCRQARTREVSQWNLNLAMYFGNQYVAITREGRDAGKLYNTPRARNSERITINRMKPLIRTELARLLSQKPAASVIPASSEDQDLMAAQAGEQVWESIYDRSKFHLHFSRASFWTVTTGTGFMKTVWDGDKLDPTSKVRGNIAFSSVQPYNLFVPDLLEQEIEDQMFVIEVSVKPVEWVNYIFKDSLDKPVQAETRAALSLLEDAFNTSNSNTAKPDSVFVFEAWIKPGAVKYMPNGGFAMIVGNELVAASFDGIPYQHQEFPYTKFEHIPTAKFYASSVIEDATAPQKEYNKIRSQIATNRRRTGNISYLAYKGSILPEKVTNEAGQFILARFGMPLPQQQQPPNLPAYLSENMDRALSDIEDISGQHQVSKGNVPAGVTAATAISYLQERDDSLLTHTYQSIEAGTERIARQALNLAVQYWEEPRLVQVVGADGAFDTSLLRGSDIANGTDVRIEAGSALPQSKAAKQALIMDMMKFGWIKVEDGLKMMEVGGAQKIFEQLRQDERQAQRENIRMKSLSSDIITQFENEWLSAAGQDPNTIDTQSGQPLDIPPVISVHTYDNHAVHIEVHNRFRRGQAFELLDADVQAQFEAHVQQHMLMLAQTSGTPFDTSQGMALPSDGQQMPSQQGMGQQDSVTQMINQQQQQGGGQNGSVGGE